MKRLLQNFTRLFHKNISSDINKTSSIIGSWRLLRYTDSQNEDIKPHWKEVWSFAAMDESEKDGIYVCDYINLHSIVGKWVLQNNSIKLQRKESENDYYIAELSADTLILEPHCTDLYKAIVFQRVQ
jgi:hypothetical protein